MMATLTVDQLHDDWWRLARRYCSDQTLIESIFKLIVEHYGERHRHYHTLQHIQEIFSELADPVTSFTQPIKDGVHFSVWFHDIIYQPGKRQNEDRSVILAEEYLRSLSVPNDLIELIRHSILCTKLHEDPAHRLDTELFLDADMSILGKPKRAYQSYSEKVRQEFKHIPEPAYKQGRRKFLKSTLEKRRVFFTDFFYEKYEMQARRNILDELSQL